MKELLVVLIDSGELDADEVAEIILLWVREAQLQEEYIT